MEYCTILFFDTRYEEKNNINITFNLKEWSQSFNC